MFSSRAVNHTRLLLFLLVLPQDGIARQAPHRRREGKIKVRLTPRVFQRLYNAEDDGSQTSGIGFSSVSLELEQNNSIQNSQTFEVSNKQHKSWRSTLSRVLPRCLLLLVLAVVSMGKPIIAPTSSAASQGSLLTSPADHGSSIWNGFKNIFPSRLSMQWSKLIPQQQQLNFNSLTTSLLSSMLIVWLPTLAAQGAWLELLLLGMSLASSSKLRFYTQYELWPAVWSTLKKMLLGEVWKHVWEFVLHPFPSNVLVPARKERSSSSKGGNDDNPLLIDESIVGSNFMKSLSSSMADLWHRMNVRIDRMTSSLLKKTVEKTVETSVGQLFPDPWSSDILSPNTRHVSAA
ncbi:hypothetical protein IV203_021923 [Nitzschia inconspicua]|uniref:Uncharacterized protein n=1 Tax=Nitzschia inconspicua TaxID=303405 RepID=A0A9K3PEA2_9STRA|nr:hypothetical protein IV203_021923 [Nitzschia inconspicua]